MKPRAPAASVVASALAFLALAGCARTAEERQLDAMRSDIEHIQRDRDREDDVTPVASAAAPAPPPNPAPAPPPPTFDAVQMEGSGVDDSDADYQDPQDTSPRPVIRLVGSGRPGSRDRLGEEGVEDSSEDASSSLDPEAKRAYDAALAQVNAKEYGPALAALAAFLVKWPDHPYADHAMYWRGECYFAQHDFARAAEQFEGVLARFPGGMKAPDALYKLVLTYRKLGQGAQARSSYDRLLQDYPQSDAARQAQSAPADPANGEGPAPNSRPSGASSVPAPEGHP